MGFLLCGGWRRGGLIGGIEWFGLVGLRCVIVVGGGFGDGWVGAGRVEYHDIISLKFA